MDNRCMRVACGHDGRIVAKRGGSTLTTTLTGAEEVPVPVILTKRRSEDHAQLG